jgi:hypothetical protein
MSHAPSMIHDYRSLEGMSRSRARIESDASTLHRASLVDSALGQTQVVAVRVDPGKSDLGRLGRVAGTDM